MYPIRLPTALKAKPISAITVVTRLYIIGFLSAYYYYRNENELFPSKKHVYVIDQLIQTRGFLIRPIRLLRRAEEI